MPWHDEHNRLPDAVYAAMQPEAPPPPPPPAWRVVSAAGTPTIYTLQHGSGRLVYVIADAAGWLCLDLQCVGARTACEHVQAAQAYRAAQERGEGEGEHV